MAVGDPDPFFFCLSNPYLFQVRRVPADENALREVLKEYEGRVAAVILEPLVQGCCRHGNARRVISP